MSIEKSKKSVVVIGAGPVGVAAAAHLLSRDLVPVVLEKGPSAGSAMLKWGHVHVFTPWRMVMDDAVVSLLESTGWSQPDKDEVPTGKEIVEEYLIPAASVPEMKDRISYNVEVVAVSKRGLSKSSSKNRDETPYTIHYKTGNGFHQVIEADAVIDASGTWSNPNPIGADGLPVPGEQEAHKQITYGIPDMLGNERVQYQDKTTLVLGGGHSAVNVVLDLMKLKAQSSGTKVVWGLRRHTIEKLLGGALNSELPARAALGAAAKSAINNGDLEVLVPMSVQSIQQNGERLTVNLLVDGESHTVEVDQIVVTTGFRPDLDMLRELRLDLDDVVEAPKALAPLIDPNIHSCGSVRPHGVNELSHTDKDFYIVGMKAYGRAPTFLMRTGYAQVRSIADSLAGHVNANQDIEVNLPSDVVCGTRANTEDSAESSGDHRLDGHHQNLSTSPPACS